MSHTFKPPVTALQKSWLKALLADPRIHLFFTEEQHTDFTEYLKDVDPLYEQTDFYYFDRNRDGDDYSEAGYREHFHNILTALKEDRFLFISYAGRKAPDTAVYEVFPCQLQYSSKDDKFRLYGFWQKNGRRLTPITLNVGRILGCHISKREKPTRLPEITPRAGKPVIIEISGERNSLERSMLHFASYEKHTEYDEERDVYYCSIFYDQADETELLIQILSFGPFV